MKRSRLYWLLLLPMALLLWAMKSAASWRPQLVGIQTNADSPMVSPDGQLLIVGSEDSFASGQVWDLVRGRPLWHTDDVTLMFSWDSQNVLTAHLNAPAGWGFNTLNIASFQLCDARTGKVIRSFVNRHPWRTKQADERFLDIGFSRDGHELRIATSFHLQRFDVATGRLLTDVKWPALTNSRQGLADAAFSFERSWVAAFDPALVFFDANTGKKLRRSLQVRRHSSDSTLTVLPDDTMLCETSDATNQGTLSAVSDGKIVWTSSQWPTFSRDGKYAFVPSATALDVLDSHTGRKLRTLPGPQTYGFDASPDGNWLYEARNGKIYRWRAR